MSTRAQLFRGSVEAVGVAIPKWLGATEVRRRALLVLDPSSTVHPIAGALIVTHSPRRVHASRALGAPLAAIAGALVAAPFSEAEVRALDAGCGDVVLVEAGIAVVSSLAAAPAEDPSTWVDLGPLERREATPLGPPPRAPRALLAPPPSVREAMGDNVPAASSQAEEVHRALLAHTGRAAPGVVGAWFSAASSIVAAVAHALRPRPSSGPTRGLASVSAPHPGPSLIERARARLLTWAAKLLVLSRLASHVHRRHAEYLERMVGMFDRNDFDAALRHAIPLGGGSDRNALAEPAFGTPDPRASLQIEARRGGVASVLALPPELLEHLRRHYRRAFTRLDERGDIERAAFVLAELLRADEEAVAYLERHGKLRLAAEIAEARKLPMGLVIRQWFLAGEVARAIALARLHGALADAVTRLSARSPDDGRRLRIFWANALAEAGDFAGAVDALGDDAGARDLAIGFLDRAIAAGGVAGARMLVKRLALQPDEWPALRPALFDLCDRAGSDGSTERAAMATEILRSRSSPASRRIAIRLVRAVLRDRSLGEPTLSSAQLRSLVVYSEDAALRADLPTKDPAPARPPLCDRAATTRTIDTRDVGALAVFDAAPLPRGRTLLALGEAGVRIVDEGGRTVAHFDQPAKRLVVSTALTRAIVAMPRGDSVRLARIDLASRRSKPWTEARLAAFADTFDGLTWVVLTEEALLAIDATEEGFRDLARVSQDRWGAAAVAHHAAGCTVLQDGAVSFRDVPSLQLRRTLPLPESAAGIVMAGAVGATEVVEVQLDAAQRTLVLHALSPPRSIPLAWGPVSWVALSVSTRWIATAHPTAEGVCVQLRSASDLTVRHVIELLGATRAAVRALEGPERVVITDDRGRVEVVALDTGEVVRSIRVRA